MEWVLLKTLGWTLQLGSLGIGEARSHLDNQSPKDGALLSSLYSPETPRKPNDIAKGAILAATLQGKGCGAKMQSQAQQRAHSQNVPGRQKYKHQFTKTAKNYKGRPKPITNPFSTKSKSPQASLNSQ